jgi:hypothetical protein
MFTRSRLGLASAGALLLTSGTALISGGIAATPAGAITQSASSTTASQAQVTLKSSTPQTTLWIHGKAAHVWKTWYHYSKGGYKGHFGAKSVNANAFVIAEIYWNSGRHEIKNVKPNSTHVYYGAKKIYLRVCDMHGQTMYCSAKW